MIATARRISSAGTSSRGPLAVLMEFDFTQVGGEPMTGREPVRFAHRFPGQASSGDYLRAVV